MSTITMIPAITEFSEATPGLWNSRLSTIEDNLNALNTVGPSTLSGSQATIGDTLSVDTIVEYTSANGVNVDGVLLKDSGVSASDLSASHITASDITSSALSVSGAAYVDTVNEYTAANGVTIDGVLIRDSAISVDAIDEFGTSGVSMMAKGLFNDDGPFATGFNIVSNSGTLAIGASSAAGINFYANSVKVGQVTSSGNWTFYVGAAFRLSAGIDLFVNRIFEQTGGNGIRLASTVNADVINEYTAANGVTIEGVLIRDSAISTDNIYETTAAAGVTIDSVLLKDSDVSASEVVLSGQTIAVRGTHTPASGTASGETGDITWDEDFLYVCRSTDSWVRVALSAF